MLLIFMVSIPGLFLWKAKKLLQLLMGFKKILDESDRKPDKIWVDKDSEYHNKSMKSWLQHNDIEMYSTYNERKFVATERFIRTLKKKIKNM